MLSQTNNWMFIAAAYSAAWIAVAGYWVFVHRAVRIARSRYEQALASSTPVQGRPQ